jgi:hypothetical protein
MAQHTAIRLIYKHLKDLLKFYVLNATLPKYVSNFMKIFVYLTSNNLNQGNCFQMGLLRGFSTRVDVNILK